MRNSSLVASTDHICSQDNGEMGSVMSAMGTTLRSRNGDLRLAMPRDVTTKAREADRLLGTGEG